MLGATIVGMISLAVLKNAGLLGSLGFWSTPIVALSAWLPARWSWRRAFKREDQQLSQAVTEAAVALERRLLERSNGPALPSPGAKPA